MPKKKVDPNAGNFDLIKDMVYLAATGSLPLNSRYADRLKLPEPKPEPEPVIETPVEEISPLDSALKLINGWQAQYRLVSSKGEYSHIRFQLRNSLGFSSLSEMDILWGGNNITAGGLSINGLIPVAYLKTFHSGTGTVLSWAGTQALYIPLDLRNIIFRKVWNIIGPRMYSNLTTDVDVIPTVTSGVSILFKGGEIIVDSGEYPNGYVKPKKAKPSLKLQSIKPPTIKNIASIQVVARPDINCSICNSEVTI